jgi:hypothetical protein
MWGAIAKRDLGIAVLGFGRAIAFGVWECDSEARPRNRFWGCVGCDRCLGFWECDSEARPRNRFWDVGVRSLFEDVGSAIAVWDVRGAIAVFQST